MYVHVTYPMNKWFFIFLWLIYLCFCMFAYRLLTVRFFQALFSSQTQKYCPLNFVWFAQEYVIFLSKVFKFHIVTIFTLNYCYTVITCFAVMPERNQVLLKVISTWHNLKRSVHSFWTVPAALKIPYFLRQNPPQIEAEVWM